MKSPRDQDIVSLWGWGQGHLFHHETTRLSRGGGGAWKISLILKLFHLETRKLSRGGGGGKVIFFTTRPRDYLVVGVGRVR